MKLDLNAPMPSAVMVVLKSLVLGGFCTGQFLKESQ